MISGPRLRVHLFQLLLYCLCVCVCVFSLISFSSIHAMARKQKKGKATVVVVAKNGLSKNQKRRLRKRQGVVTGKGDYDLGTAYRNVGGDLGGAMGAPRAGRFLGGAISVLRGHGDYYPVRANSLMKGNIATPVPKFHNGGRRSVNVVEREFLGTVLSTTSFTNVAYPINPGVSLTFPWLSAIALNFEEYKVNGMLFEFVSQSADWNGSNQAIGTIVMATDYDSSDADYSSRIEMENADYALSTRANESNIHCIECAPDERPTNLSYVRVGAVPLNADVKMYDHGKFQIATDGFATAGVVIGELWVSYDISFFKKAVSPSSSTYATSFSTTTSTVAAPFGSKNTRITWGVCDMRAELLTVTFYGLPLGVWYFRAWFVASTGSYTNLPTASTYTNCTGQAVDDSIFEQSSLVPVGFGKVSFGTSAQYAGTGVAIRVTGANPTITFVDPSFAFVSGTVCYMEVFKLSNGSPLNLLVNDL